MEYVLVNGTIVKDADTWTGKLGGTGGHPRPSVAPPREDAMARARKQQTKRTPSKRATPKPGVSFPRESAK
jgi:hypothetical protein